jgi:PAS domain S-box-containing protein
MQSSDSGDSNNSLRRTFAGNISMNRSTPTRIAVIYFLVGVAWVWLSDGFLVWSHFQSSDGYVAGAIKGSLFIACSTALVYWLVYHHWRSISQANSLLRAVTDESTDAVFVKDREGKYLLFNSAAARFVGKPIGEVLGKDDRALFDAESASIIQNSDRKVMSEEKAHTTEEKLTSAEVTRTYMAMKAPFRDEKGQIAGVIGISRDITDRITVEENIRLVKARLNEAQRISGIGSWSWEPGGKIFWSESIYEIYGLSPKTFTPSYEKYLELVHPEDRSLVMQRSELLINGLDEQILDVRIVRSDGEIRWLHSRSRATRDAEGNLIRLEGVEQDITDRKLAEEALHRSEKRFREFADSIPQIAWIADPTGALTHLNSRASEFTGVSSNQLTGWSWEQVIHKDDLLHTNERWIEVLQTGIPKPIEMRIKSKHGEYRWHITRQVPSRDSNGNITTWYGTCTDIDDFKKVQNALKDERNLLRTMIDSIPDPIFVKDTAGKFVLSNRAHMQFNGLTTESALLGKTVFDLFPLNYATQYHEADMRIIKTGEAIDNSEEIARDASGQDSWRQVNKAPLRDHDGAIIGLVGMSRNIQKRKEYEQLLAERQERLTMAFSAAQMGAWDWDLQTNRVHRSPECQAIYGQDLAHTPEAFYKVLHPEDRAYVEASFQKSTEQKTNFEVEYRIIRSKDDIRWVSDIGRCHFDEQGRPARLIGVVQDITEKKALEAVNKQAEIAFKESEERLRLALHAGRMGTFDWDIPTNKIVWSDSHYELFGYNPAQQFQIEFHHFADRLYPEDRDRVEQDIRSAMLNKTDYVNESRILLPDGTIRWIMGSGAFHYDGSGNPIRMLGVAFDITDRKRNEAAITEIKTRLTEAQRLSKTGSWSWEPQTDKVWWSETLFEIFGVDQKSVEPSFDNFLQLLHPDDRNTARNRVEAILQGAEGFANDLRVIRSDGTLTWIHSRGIATRDANGNVIRVEGTDQEFTERKRNEEALRESESRLRLALHAASAIAFVWDSQTDSVTRFYSTEPALPSNVGHPSTVAEVRAQVHPEDRDVFDAGVRKCLESGTEYRNLYRVIRSDSSIAWLEEWGYLERDRDGAPRRLTGVSIDVTERKRAEEESKTSEARFQSLFAALAEGVVFQGLDGKILECNESAQRILGLTRDQMLSYSTLDEYWGCIREDFSALPGEEHPTTFTARTGMPCTNVVVGITKVNGAVTWIAINTEPLIRPGDTSPYGIVCSFSDITERKRTDDSLRESERRQTAILNALPAHIALLDSHGSILAVNEAWRRFGVENSPDHRDHSIGLNYLSICEASTVDCNNQGVEVAEGIREVLSGRLAEFRMDYPCHSPNQENWYQLVVDPLSEGPKSGAVVMHLNITNLKKTERDLRESEERYRKLVDVLPTALFIHSEGKIVFCNPEYIRLIGANSEAEILGRNPFDFIHPDYHAIARARMAKMADTNQSMPGIEIRLLRPDGKTLPAYSVSTPLTYHGKPAYLIALTDLTERERSMNLLTSVMNSVNDAIVTIDERGKIGSVNPSTERAFGYSKAELLGENVRVLMPKPHQGEHDTYLSNYLTTGVAKVIGIGRELEGKRKNGTTFPLELTVTEFYLEGERHFTGVIRDITSRKQLEAQFQQSQKMEAVGRLAGGVAHDFNNLLTVINGYGDLVLMELPVGDPKRESIAAIRDAGDRAARLTQQLLAFSRKALIEPKILDLNDMVMESSKLLRRLIGEDIVLAVIPDHSLARIKADPGQLEQVIMNLCVNARDAMPNGGRLTIETRHVKIDSKDRAGVTNLKEGHYARLSVTDTGQGMTEELMSKIFEPFFTTKGVGQGTGLGLAVVHGVVEQCGGSIQVQSKVGAGTTFKLYFPIVEESMQGATTITQKVPSRGTETILLVEDESAVRTIARMALETQGYRVLEVERGNEALRIATEQTEPLHLMVTDVVMPEMGGRQLVGEMRKILPDLKVLYMSGYTDDRIVHQGIMNATDSFLSKPFTPLELARKVRSILDGKG